MSVNPISGTAGADRLAGTAADDLIYGNDPYAATATAPSLELLTDGLGQAVAAAAAPGIAGTLYVLTRDGTVRAVDMATGTVAATPFLDIRPDVDSTTGLAFHPDFASNGKFYVFAINLAGNTEIREYRVDPASPDQALAGSEKLIITIAQPNGDGHRGGTVVFAEDGTLLITTGDAGTANAPDPFGTGQDPTDLLGSVLRIDVDRDGFRKDPSRNYAIPADNPFADGVGGAPEVWAYGFRNPFRAGVDRGTADVYIGDVGEASWEEIDLGVPGANYGWSRYEGPVPFPIGSAATPTDGVTFPVYSYSHASGDGQSVTGGLVYRGPETGLQGRYIFGDFVTGRIFAIDDRDGDGVWQRTEIDNGGLKPGSLAGFTEDANGTLYAIGLDFGASADGTLYRLRPGQPGGAIDAGDTIDGGRGSDRIFAGAGDDSATGGAGNDLLQGMEGSDTLDGSGGNDSLVGGNSNDVLRGAGGKDTLLGGVGRDSLDGGGGADILWGGLGTDLLHGGGGADRFTFSTFGDSPTVAAADLIDDFEGGIDRIDLARLADGLLAFRGAEAFVAGGGPQVRLVATVDGSRLEASDDGASVDFALLIRHTAALTAADFLL